MTDEELAEIEERHWTAPESTASAARQVCVKDLESPCDALALLAEVKRLEVRVAELEDVLIRTGEALTTCQMSLEGHFETLHRLAMHYPEAQHILASPRKHETLVLIEAIVHRLRSVTEGSSIASNG